MWSSVVGYFTDSSKISSVHGIITLLIIKELFENQRVVCINNEKDYKVNIIILCESRLLFNYTSNKISKFDDDEIT